ncbi:4-hydroxythreonine-4-phosphate dehydrogenase PdxA [Limnohabitans sp.]|uniref:PdxA family dehydrogenase n=1 Tax=Limnohabitans sp. TaxID=1907725 RepID=UPI0033412DAD
MAGLDRCDSRVALTAGDPNGVGPEIALKALAVLPPEQRNRVTLFGPVAVLQKTATSLHLQDVLSSITLVSAGEMSTDFHVPGQVDPAAGRSAIESATAAIQACRRGEFDGVVAGPHHETAIAQAGIAFSGYPSLVASVCGLTSDSVFLMLVGGGLRIVHVTLHESVEIALGRMRTELVMAATQAGVLACQRLGVSAPRVALFGINPHASEGTLFGQHDAECTVPAAHALNQSGLSVSGPMGADVLLANHATDPHDLYVAMFHDQGHIPIKLLAPQSASAFSIGADVLLASTGHGSAMDIAGTGQAKPDALLRSLRMLLGLAPLLHSQASVS